MPWWRETWKPRAASEQVHDAQHDFAHEAMESMAMMGGGEMPGH